MIDIADLISALQNIADITSDPVMASTARRRARLLATKPSNEFEPTVKSIRDELNDYKSDFRDSLDQSESTQTAISTAYDVAKRTINELIRARQARRP
jgi:hypothetical protein